MDYRKYLLKSDWYHFKVTQAYLEEDKLKICFTVDTGEDSYRHVIESYTLDKYNIGRLIRLFADCGYILIEDKTHAYFIGQFIGLRVQGKVDRWINNSVVKNAIIELKEPTAQPSYDVMKEKTDKHYFKEKKGRELPLFDETKGLSRGDNQ